MRLAVLVDPRPTEPVPPAVRGERLLWLRDCLVRLGFDVVALGDQPDVPQLDRVLDGVEAADTVLVHVSGSVASAGAVRIGLAQSLGLSAVAACVEAKNPASVLYFVELTYGGAPDALKAAEHAAAIRAAVDGAAQGRAALLALGARTVDRDPLAFTRLALGVAEDMMAGEEDGVALSAVVDRLREKPESGEVAQSYALVRSKTEFRLSPASPEKPAVEPLVQLADGARDAKKWEQALAGYRAALLVADSGQGPIHARIGGVERERGNVLKARRAFERALLAQPGDAAVRDAIIALAVDAEEWPRAIELARERLAAITAPAERVDELFGIARMLGKQGDMPAAVSELEAARAVDPKNGDVLEALRRAYKVLSRWSKLLEVTGALADLAPSALERAARLVAQAHVAVDHLQDEDRAVHFLEAALDEDPTHDEALDLLVELRTLRGERLRLTSTLEGLLERYAEMGDGERQAETSRRLDAVREAIDADDLVPEEPEAQPPPASRVEPREVRETQEARDEQATTGDHAEAAASSSADDEPAPETKLPETARPETARPETEIPELALADGPASDKTGDDLTPPIAAAVSAPDLADALTEVPPDEPSESPLTEVEAKRAVAMMAGLPPAPEGFGQDTEVGSMPDLTASVSGSELPLPPRQDDSTLELEEARRQEPVPEESADELEAKAAKAPLDVAVHQQLFALHRQSGDADRAYLEALALEELGALDQEHEDVLEEGRPDGLRVRATLDAAGWRDLQAPGGDEVVEALFGALGRAAIAVYVDERRARRKLAALDPSRRLPESSTASIVRSFHWAARVLDVPCPELYVLDTVFGDIAAVPAREPSTVVGPAVLRGLRTKDLAFLAGRHLAYYRPGFDVLLYFPTLSDLTVLLLAGVRVILPEMPMPKAIAPQVAALCSGIATRLTGEERVALAEAVRRLEARGGKVDLTAWSRSVELTAGRAGLLLCGDLRTVMLRLRTETRTVSGATLDDKRADLLACCASRGLADLRSRVSVTASAPPPRSSGMMAAGSRAPGIEWASGFERSNDASV